MVSVLVSLEIVFGAAGLQDRRRTGMGGRPAVETSRLWSRSGRRVGLVVRGQVPQDGVLRGDPTRGIQARALRPASPGSLLRNLHPCESVSFS
jgi:hypothetical protein